MFDYNRIRVLTLDAFGVPTNWADLDKFAYHQAKGNILWTMGEEQVVLRGGFNKDGIQSEFRVPTIIAVKGKAEKTFRSATNPTRDQLAGRDRHTCAYCGDVFKTKDLRKEHIFPKARGGPNTWMNLVSACEKCNGRKACRTPEEAKMPLLYLPYVPNQNESMILRNRNILADQMEFLLAGVGKKSRLLDN